MPPAWFLGVDRVLLGRRDAYLLALAQMAAVAFIGAGAIAFGSSVILYRRFDRLMLHAFGVTKRRRRRRRGTGNPARAAIRDFTSATLRRSALHQGVAIGLSACGVALAVNGLLSGGLGTWLRGLAVSRLEIFNVFSAIAGMPFPLIIVLGIAARTALALPIEPRANWIFRMTERDATRVDQLGAAERVVTRFAVLIPRRAHAADSVDGRRPACHRGRGHDRRVRAPLG